MKFKNLHLIGLVILGGATLVSSCKKDKVETPSGPITLDCNHFKTAQTLVDDPDEPVDYYINCVMDVEADITVNPGVVIEFGADAGISVNSGGSFKARGTAADKITFSGESKTAGFWKGIFFNSSSTNNLLHYVNINHAGSSTFNTNNDIASVIIWANTRLDLQNVNIAQGGSHGISAVYTNSNWKISDSRISACENAPMVFLPSYLAYLDGSNDFTGNAKDYLLIELSTDYINANITLRKSSVPYRVTSTYAYYTELYLQTGTMTVEPGVEVFFEDGLGMQVDEDATLIAVGTPTERIRFTGVTQVAGAWSSIYFDANTSTSNELGYVDIQYAGATLDGENCGVLMRVNPVLKLDNVAFSDIAGCSVFNMSANLNPNLTSSNLTHDNTGGSLCNY